MQSRHSTAALKVIKVPPDRACVAVLEADCARMSRSEKLRPRSYVGRDGAGWSFQKFFDVHKSMKTIRSELPHNMDFGFQAIPGDFINFVLFVRPYCWWLQHNVVAHATSNPVAWVRPEGHHVPHPAVAWRRGGRRSQELR